MQQIQQNGTMENDATNTRAGASSSSPAGNYNSTGKRPQISGGRFDFEDGGTYCGGWEDGKAHGFGVCTGPKHQGAYSGAWNYGFEVSGVYIWPSGSHYEGQWQNGRRHGLGVEQRGRLIYRGEWSKDGHKGRYGVRESTVSTAKYEGTWNVGYQDGYGCETYADGGTYQGQWQEGKRHGYGMRTSAPFGMASHYKPKNVHASLSSLRSNENADPADKRNNQMDEIRGGFVLTCKSDKLPVRRNSLTEKTKKGFLSGLKMRKQRSTGDLEKRGTIASGSIRSTMSTASWLSTGSEQSNLTAKSAHTESNASFTMEDEQLDPSVVETYMGEWKKDKRCGYGVAERSDGLKYEGEWYSNKKHGYGVTTYRDGTVEEGKYKNNVLITSQKKKHLFLARSRKFRERITASVSSAQRALKMALQRSDIAISRTATAAAKAQNADNAAEQARSDCENAVIMAREFAPDFKPSVLERFEKLRFRERYKVIPVDRQQQPAAAGSPSSGSANLLNRYEQQNQQQQQQQQQSLAFQQQQASMGGRSSQTAGASARALDEDCCPVPSSMYSQQLPVTPQTDLSSLVSPQQTRLGGYGYNNLTAVKQIQNQQYQQQYQQHQQQHQQQQQQQQQQQHMMPQQYNNPQAHNPAYQFEQQQPPGPMSPGGGGGGGGMNSDNSGTTIHKQNYAQNIMTNSSPMKQSQNEAAFREHNMHQQHQQSTFMNDSPNNTNQNSNMLRRSSRPTGGGAGDSASSKAPMLGQMNQQSSIDHFDHYKRPPSRDSSVDRYARAASRLSGGFGSRQASIDRGAGTTTDSTASPPEARARAGSLLRGVAAQGPSGTPPPITTTGNGSIPTGSGRISRAGTPSLQNRSSISAADAQFSSPNQPFEDVLLRQRTLGQDIIPSPSQPKRTESLFVPPKPALAMNAGAAGGANKKLKSVPVNVNLQRKKSLPDFQELPRATEAMSREEVSALGSARREAVRKQIEVNERLKANPLLYLVSPQVKDWFSRQQLVLLVLFANIILAILFFKMLT